MEAVFLGTEFKTVCHSYLVRFKEKKEVPQWVVARKENRKEKVEETTAMVTDLLSREK
jgi:hypothetical protein